VSPPAKKRGQVNPRPGPEEQPPSCPYILPDRADLDVAAVYLDALEVATALQVVLAGFPGSAPVRLERDWTVAP
jgi:hypothetical protein